MDYDLTPATELFSKSKISLSDTLQVGAWSGSVDDIVARLEPMLLDDRAAKIKKIVSMRSLNVVTVLENIYDRGNVSAVMRTGESLGFFKFLLIEKEKAKFKAANRITRGAEKWLHVEVQREAAASVKALKAEGYLVAGTDLNATHELSALPQGKPIALVIGNEKDGITEEMRELVDIRVKIPMVGFSQSYNLSVASALCLFELYKQQDSAKGMTERQRQQLYANYLLRCFDNPERLLRN